MRLIIFTFQTDYCFLNAALPTELLPLGDQYRIHTYTWWLLLSFKFSHYSIPRLRLVRLLFPPTDLIWYKGMRLIWSHLFIRFPSSLNYIQPLRLSCCISTALLTGYDPITYWLTVSCSTYWATEAFVVSVRVELTFSTYQLQIYSVSESTGTTRIMMSLHQPRDLFTVSPFLTSSGGGSWNHIHLSLIHISEPTRPY